MSQNPDISDVQSQAHMGQPQAIHAAMEGMVTFDDQMRIIMINPAAQRMFGWTAEQAVGQGLGKLIPQRLRSRHEQHIKQFLDSEAVELANSMEGELIGLRANGEEFPLKSAICKVELDTANGRQRCCTALLCDRSEEQTLTQLVDNLNRKMQAVFERAPIAIWITNADRIAFANPASSALFGVDGPDALIGQSIKGLLNLHPHDSGFEWSSQNPVDDTKVATLIGNIVRPDGSHREVEVAVTELPDHGERFVQMVIVDTTQRSKERHDLLVSRHTLRALSASIVNAREEERQHLARELHDELGQRLTALKLELATFDRDGAGRTDNGRLQHMIDMVDETMASTRRLATGLRPPMLDDLGLEAAIEWLVSEFKRHHPIEVELTLQKLPKPAPPSVSISVYRLLQEALTNIQRHSGAQRIGIELSLHDRWLQLVVQDDGEGFPASGPEPRKGSFGLIGMRERVRMLGGQLHVKNAAGGGARLVARLPLLEGDSAQPSWDHDLDTPAAESQAIALNLWQVP